MKVRAWLHLHTVCSGDADLTYAELVAAAKAAGIGALFLTEHREAMDDEGIRESVRACREHSDADLVLVPGLEIASDERYHVLGFGLIDAVAKGPAVAMAAAMREAGALPVLAHPTRYRPGWEETLPDIGAVEVWNRHYDGRVAPPRAVVRELHRGRAVDKELHRGRVRPLFGLDAHGAVALSGALPEMILEVPVLSEEALRVALREGRAQTAVDGRPYDAHAGGGLRALAGGSYRGLRRIARRIAYALPFSDETRKRLGRKW